MIHFFQVSLGDNLGLAVCRVCLRVCMREREKDSHKNHIHTTISGNIILLNLP